MSLNVVPLDRFNQSINQFISQMHELIVHGFLLVFYSNIFPKIIDFKYAVTVKTRLGVRQGH